jgi:hypothetical protein
VSSLSGKIHIKDQEINLMKDRVAESKRTMEKCIAEHEAKSKLIE